MKLPELSRDQYETLLFMVGFATGAAHQQENKRLANSFLRLANVLFADDPDFVPYQLWEDGEKD